ncbi:beta-hydroxyacyl-ACP dehydratase [uncultured Duncaniella sp.]|uniref:beta-hydroxyacyl-ACP dehydratase n=1 Tax=uncultured Duncaniella sp. TaxID=2768039 RepID=UPI00266FBF7E|nr:beta-hydroxyacyl-ACP dehydratase [uncultured Duncaniella sp.]
MTLKNNLYNIVSSGADSGSFRLALNPDCGIYRAHFPGKPITPGVCIIQIVSELLPYTLGFNVELHSVSNAKFLAVINPLETPTVNCCLKKIMIDDEKEDVKVTAVFCNEDTIFTKLSLVYRKR